MKANRLVYRGGAYLTQTSRPEKIGGLVYVIVGLVGVAITTSCLTLRLSSIRNENSLRQLSVIHFLMLAIYILGIAFCTSSLILYYGYGTEDVLTCHLAIIFCLVFYLGQKIPLYTFLVERTHAVRSVTRSRLQDPVYLSGLALIILGFGSITAALFVWSVWEYDPALKKCWIGFGFKTATALLAYDLFINIWLTAVFLHYVRPYLTKGLVNTFVPRNVGDLMVSRHRENSSARNTSIAISQPALVRMISRTLFAAIGMCVTTIANIVIMMALNGHEPAWWCFTFCSFDVVWAVIITHYLTSTPINLGKFSFDQNSPTIDSEHATRYPQRSFRRDVSILSTISRTSTAEQELAAYTPTNGEHVGENKKDINTKTFPKAENSRIDTLLEGVLGNSGNKRAMNPSTGDGRRTSPGAERPDVGSRESSRTTTVIRFTSI